MTADELGQVVVMHRQRLVSAFRDPGAWGPVRASYGVGDLGAREPEMRACLEALCGWARTAAGGIGGQAATDLTARLGDLVRETMDEVAPPATGAKAGLAAIFKNATANVGWWKQRAGDARPIHVARCRSCGATQTTALLFDCEYCGNFLYGNPGGSDET